MTRWEGGDKKNGLNGEGDLKYGSFVALRVDSKKLTGESEN